MPQIFSNYLLIMIGVTVFASCDTTPPEHIAVQLNTLPEVLDYNFHVKPILSDKCFACHGPDAEKREAGFRLDTYEGATSFLKDNESMQGINPGSWKKSEVYHRIISEDSNELMPPPESNLKLTAHEIAILSKWIKDGAEYKPHWAFISPEKTEIPKVENKEWTTNVIDHFVLKRIEERSLSPSQQASKETLIRRLTFSLTGLPPSLQEIHDYVNDTSPNAYDKAVDRLLVSKAYGERMAMDWMDVARYADSDGYLDDKHRNFSPWRDWVIRSFNENMSYDQFVTWQIAGDLIPNATQESILATAFNRLHKKNSEAGIVFEEYRTEYVADRTNTLGKGILAMSLECARCHDHKYDPISQKDYYKVFGFFNSTNELGTAIYGPGQTPGPSLLLTNDSVGHVIDYLKAITSQQEDTIHYLATEPAKGFDEWAGDPKKILRSVKENFKKGLLAHYSFDNHTPLPDGKTYRMTNSQGRAYTASATEPELKKGVFGKGLFLKEYTTIHMQDSLGAFERTEPFSIELWVHPDTIYEDASFLFHTQQLRYGLKGYSLHLENNQLKFIMAHSWPNNALEVVSQERLSAKEWTKITITYDGTSSASGIKLYINDQLATLDVRLDNLYRTIKYIPNIHTYEGYRPFTLGARDKFKALLNGGMDELKVYNRVISPLEVSFAYNKTRFIDKLYNDSIVSEQLLTHYQLIHDKDIIRAKKAYTTTQEQLNEVMSNLDQIMVLGDLKEPRPTYVLERGDYRNHGEQVEPGVPEHILPYKEEWPKNRLGLSKWLFDKKNPLTARVFVNRIWQMHFGEGLVKTSEDFGSQGDLPTHPELLDWLAVDFMESGWDVKRLHKLIVSSSTFKQSAVRRKELQSEDPANDLLARGPSFRLPAEMIRDNALAISGLLVEEIGGPSVYPYQPEGLWEELSTKSWRYKYLQEPGEGLYRRSLYTVWKRTSPPPSMQIFDAPDRGFCTVRRKTTSTPLQALVLLNDPQYVEAARALAERLEHNFPKNSTKKLNMAFELITGRKPNSEEQEMILNYYKHESDKFKKDQDKAAQYLSNGTLPIQVGVNTTQLAALASTVSSMMNTVEAYTRY